ncbi:SCP-like protein [Necator americanus]|uniref:SCP-like protein n=1 Tax=Necator americanus TaxID=51031 RepID=W2TLY1_NECAM|nr:SCP-like protein [Necator americanus]ETN82146.1 SCP-like protein [Necator americanus]
MSLTNPVPISDYQCWNFKSTNDIRQRYHNNINNLRRDIANGALAQSTKWPRGQNIYRLYWDCKLEEEAQALVEQCSLDVKEPDNAALVISSADASKTCDRLTFLKTQVVGWCDAKTVGAPANPPVYDGDSKFEKIAKFAYGKATKLGCAQKMCGNQLYMACLIFANSENRYTFPNTALAMDVIATRAPNRWWLEIENKGMDQNADLNKFRANHGVSHWARMAWDSNKSVGCAAYKCPNFINAICRYESGGVQGEQIYKMGPECKRCSTINTNKCEEGLCVL